MRSVVGRPGGGSWLCCWFAVRSLPPVAVSLGPASVSRWRVRFGRPPRGTATTTATSEIAVCVPLCFPTVFGLRFRVRVSGSKLLVFSRVLGSQFYDASCFGKSIVDSSCFGKSIF